ncbi:hypothetical protein CHS0354_040928 [Potamilus streckersoni]|uniref:guanylate cyclase n=1 Tax=Potamilus streckersoni TaxID=2493646 RepID=A0AAE0VYY2_9BIVA|nr:hypothetical protein CHS0354_040928 [Potamilus streckersoni]
MTFSRMIENDHRIEERQQNQLEEDEVQTEPLQSKQTGYCLYKRDGIMYGILLESVQEYICRDYGSDLWQNILEHAGMKNMVFSTHKTYKDDSLKKIAAACCVVLNKGSMDEYMDYFGKCFVEFCSSYGYDRVLRVAGRHYRDFLHGIDNLHEVLRFSFPKMRSPSFIIESEDEKGCILIYRSKRYGFKNYVTGQLKQCAKMFYKVEIQVEIQDEEFVDNKYHVRFCLRFDNSVYKSIFCRRASSEISRFSSISSTTFFRVFPFCIVFDEDLMIQNIGSTLRQLLKEDNLIGSPMLGKFRLRRPLFTFTWQNVLSLQSVTFELEYRYIISQFTDQSGASPDPSGHRKHLLLKGQMKFIQDWNAIIFLCTPLLNNLDVLENVGLFISDLNMFDNSQDMVMAGWQHASELECSIEHQVEKIELIKENMEKLEEWRKKSNDLLYSMIPCAIADRLKHGEDPIKTCEAFDEVTIMFSYLVGFSDICGQASAIQIVECINNVFTLFDNIIDKYDVFKVETLGDAVYMVAGGVPDRKSNHAQSVAGLALELMEKSQALKDPITDRNLRTRIGMHTGSVVGGVVGKRMPQYCLFGDTVNTASRMQTYSEPGHIHLSEPCHKCLEETEFVTVLRGKVNIKGKGEMNTYWLAGRQGEERTAKILKQIKEEKLKSFEYRSSENGFDLHGMHAATSVASFKTIQQEVCPSFSDMEALSSKLTCSDKSLSKTNQEQDIDGILKEKVKVADRVKDTKGSDVDPCDPSLSAEQYEKMEEDEVFLSCNQLSTDNHGKLDCVISENPNVDVNVLPSLFINEVSGRRESRNNDDRIDLEKSRNEVTTVEKIPVIRNPNSTGCYLSIPITVCNTQMKSQGFSTTCADENTHHSAIQQSSTSPEKSVNCIKMDEMFRRMCPFYARKFSSSNDFRIDSINTEFLEGNCFRSASNRHTDGTRTLKCEDLPKINSGASGHVEELVNTESGLKSIDKTESEDLTCHDTNSVLKLCDQQFDLNDTSSHHIKWTIGDDSVQPLDSDRAYLMENLSQFSKNNTPKNEDLPQCSHWNKVDDKSAKCDLIRTPFCDSPQCHNGDLEDQDSTNIGRTTINGDLSQYDTNRTCLEKD